MLLVLFLHTLCAVFGAHIVPLTGDASMRANWRSVGIFTMIASGIVVDTKAMGIALKMMVNCSAR